MVLIASVQILIKIGFCKWSLTSTTYLMKAWLYFLHSNACNNLKNKMLPYQRFSYFYQNFGRAPLCHRTRRVKDVYFVMKSFNFLLKCFILLHSFKKISD